jgi:gluconolactonase
MKARILAVCSALLASLPSVCVAAVAVQELTTPAIPGVVNAGTPVQLVKEGFASTEGPLPQIDGGLLFTDNQAGRIVRIAPDGALSIWYEGPGGPNALTRKPAGDIVATLIGTPAIAVMMTGVLPRVLVSDFEGKPFNRPNDLIVNERGDIYFTDPAGPTATHPAMPSAVYQLTAEGKLLRIANDIALPNGVALSPDERTLYVANTAGEWIVAFDLSRKGVVKEEQQEFAKLALPAPQNGAAAGSGADGIAVDEEGRLYVATTLGVQVFSPKGKPLGIIALPKQPQNLAFSGPDRATLFVVGRGSVYAIATLTHGPMRLRK